MCVLPQAQEVYINLVLTTLPLIRKLVIMTMHLASYVLVQLMHYNMPQQWNLCSVLPRIILRPN